MANPRNTNAESPDFYCIKTWTDCSHVGTPGYLRVIVLKRGDTLPVVGDVLCTIACNIMAPDQSCDQCGYQEKHYVTHIVHLDEKAITSMGLHQRMAEVLQDGLALPCWDWNSAPDWQEFVTDFVPDFNEVNRELIDYFASHPKELENLHWRHFEELIAAVFKNYGYETVLGTGSHDQGVDLRLIQKDPIGEVITLVQVKRYAALNPIGLEAVQALSGAVDAERANRGLLVTSSRFLPGAKAFADKLGSRLVLCGPADVARWCKQLPKTDGRI
jgi:hypothetical protein